MLILDRHYINEIMKAKYMFQGLLATLILDEVLKLKNIKKDGYTRFQHQEQYEHVGPEVTRSQEGKRSQDDDKRLCLVDDLKEFKITFMSSQRYKPKPKVKDHYIMFTR
ncbi:hypothetical protein Tco_0649621 [Tanacetum coccineum]